MDAMAMQHPGVAGPARRPDRPPPGANALDGLRLPDACPRTIVAFVGQNENGILDRISHDLMRLAAPYGLVGHVLNLSGPDWAGALEGLVREGVFFAWGAAGIGARLNPNGAPFWDAIGVPFISMLGDTPCWMPRNHNIPSRWVANGYVFRDWLNMQRRLIRSPQLSALLPLGVTANPARDQAPWAQREHRMVFVKTGCAPEAHRAEWSHLPPRYRAVVEDAASAALQAGVGDITDLFLACVDHHGLYLDQRPEILFALMCNVDVYVRDHRSTAMVKALLDLPAHIVGRGWGHVAGSARRATFHDPVNAGALPGLYANTQFLLNTMPNFSTGTHERVLHGFGAKCCVVTNENDDMRARFSRLPSYFGVDTEDGGLPDRLASIYGSADFSDGMLQPALDMVAADYSGESLMRGLIDLALEVRAAASPRFIQYGYA